MTATRGGRTAHPDEPPRDFGAGTDDWGLGAVGQLIETVAARRGYDLGRQSTQALRARLRAFAVGEGVPGPAALTALLSRDDNTFERLLLALSTVHRGLLDDAAFYRAFRDEVAPVLATYPSIRVWVPGCGTGEAAYSVAIILAEAGLAERSRIYATDPSRLAVQLASAGLFPADVMPGWRAAYERYDGSRDLDSYAFLDGDRAAMRGELRARIVFGQHDMLNGPLNEFHAIVARDVLVGFRAAIREVIHQRFLDSLVHLGFLCLGEGDSLPDAERGAYVEYMPGVRIYRRMSAAGYEPVRW